MAGTAQKARRTARAGDATGRKDDELRAKHAAELEEKSRQMALATAEEAARKDDVVDYTGKGAPTEVLIVDDEDDTDEPLSDEELLARIQSGDADPSLLHKLTRRFTQYKKTAEQDVIDQGITVLGDDTAIIRTNEDIEMMTFGKGNHLSFKAGQRYRVPQALAEHLEEKGLVWH